MISPVLFFAASHLYLAQSHTFSGNAGFDIRRDFFLTSKDAVGMLAPRVVCPATAIGLDWSYDGDYLVVDRSDSRSAEDSVRTAIDNQLKSPPTELMRRELVVYSVRREKVQAIIPINPPDVMYLTVKWLHGDDQFVVEYAEQLRDAAGSPTGMTQASALISASGHVTPLTHNDHEYVEVFVCPTAPIVAVEVTDGATEDQRLSDENQRVSLLRTNGGPLPDVVLPDNFVEFDWAVDGGAYCKTFKRVKGANPIIGWYRVNLADGKCSPVDKKPVTEAPEPTQDFDLQRLIYRIPNGDSTSRVARGFVLRSTTTSDVPRAIVTADGTAAVLSPKRDAVAYISQGIAMVRPFMKMPKDQFIAARTAAIKAAILNQAKQVALGLIIYANDYDGNFMSSTSNWQDALDPYLKDPTLTDGFVYTYAGGNMSAIESPAETILGYIDGPGGRAIAYSDGHCKWIPN